MKKYLFVFILVFFVSNTVAGFPKIPFYNNYDIPGSSFNQWRSDFTWDWIGPEGGIMWRVIIDPVNSNLGFAISDGGDLWRTVDGNTWLLVPDFLYRHPSCALYTSPDTAIVTVWNFLYNTVNGGDNWTENPQNFINIRGLSEKVSNIIYLADMDSPDVFIYRSTDHGINWTVIDTLTNINDFYLIRYDPSNDSILYIGVTVPGSPDDTTMLLKSTDMGDSWISILQENDTLDFDEIDDIEVNPYDSNEIFACFGFGSPITGPFHSTDGGNTWSQVQGALDAFLLIPFDVEFADSDTVLVTNLYPPGIFKGVNFPAVSWQFFKTDSTVGFVEVEIGTGGTIYAASAGDGIYKSTTGGNSWFPVNTNLRAFLCYPQFQAVSHFKDETLYASSIYSTPLFKTTNGGLTWQEFYYPDWIMKTAIELYPENPDIVYISGLGIKINLTDTLFFSFYRSTDGGQNWTPMDTIPNPEGVNSFSCLWVSPTDSSRLLGVLPTGSTSYLLSSTNSGSDWDTTFSDVFTMLRGTDTVFVGADTTLYVSFNKGQNWQPLAYNLWIREMSYNPENKLLYVVRFTPSGDSLSSIDLSGNLSNIADVSGSMHCMSTPGGNDIYLSFWLPSFYPLFIRSPDGGVSFEVDTLSFLPTLLRSSPNEILLADLGKSFRRSEDAVAVSLKRNRPSDNHNVKINRNIFTDHIEIRFTLQKRNYVDLTVWGVDGRFVKTIKNGNMKIGQNRLIWRGKNSKGNDVPSGIYFVKMQINGIPIFTGKVIKIK